MDLAGLLTTVSGNTFLVVGTLVLALVALAVSWVPPRGNLVFRVARLWSRGLLVASGLRLEVSREVELDPRRRYVFMSNHRSLFDIPALLASLPVQTRFLAKKSLFKIPIFGWAIALGGFINIDRENLRTARDSFASAISKLRQGASILVFPEGTRSTESEMLPFKRGGFLLALKSGLPIVPVAVSGSGRARHRGSYWIRGGVIRLHYGGPIEVDQFSVRDKKRLMNEVRTRIEELRGAGRRPAGSDPERRRGRTAKV